MIILSISPTVFSFVLILLILSLTMSAALAIYAFRMRDDKTAFLFGMIMLLVIFWCMLKISSLFIYNVQIREILHYLNIVLVIPIPPIFFLVAVYYTKFPRWFGFKHIVLLFIVPAIIIVLVLTSPFHQILFSGFRIEEQNSIPMHFYKMGYGYYLFDGYIYTLMGGAIILLFKSIINKDVFFKRQVLLFMIGGLIPFAYDVLFTLGLSPLQNYNMSCVFISFGNMFFAWSLFGYRFFKLIPITRNLVVEKMSDLMIVTNHENLIVDMNESARTFFSLKKNKVVGVSFFEIFKEYPSLIKVFFEKNKLNNEITLEKNAETIHFSIGISNVESGTAFLANIIILHDISARIKSEFEIKQLSIAVEQSPVSIITTDINGVIEYANKAFYISTGYSIKESIGRHTRILKGKTDPAIYVQLWESLLSGKVWKGEFVNKRKNGELYYSETIISPIKNDKGEIVKFIAIMNDITERKKSEIRIQLQNNKLTEVNATKDKFFSIIAHDLKNPFNSILGLSYLLVNHFDSYERSKVKQIIEHIDNTANQTYKLLENLLEWSRIQQGKLTPFFQINNLKKIVNDVLESHEQLALNKKIKINNLIDSDILLNCDRDMSTTILRNLISNAIKFTNIEGSVTIHARQQESMVEIHISDNGIGIEVERLNTLFYIEKNSSTPGTNNERGSGLGLILCREMVEMQGGNIWVNSEIDKGSRITFTLKMFANN